MALAAALPVILSTCQADKLVSPQPTGVLQLAPGSVADSAALGSAGIRGGGLEILPQGTTSLGFQLQKAQGSAWLTLTPANGSAPDTVTVALNPAGLAVGTYRDTIIASSSNSNATPLRVPVQFTVHPCREAAIPHDTLIGASLSNLDCASPLNPGHFARRYRFSAAAGDSLSFELQATGFNGVLRIDTVTTPPTAPAPHPPSLVETDRCLGVVGDPCLHYFLFTETRQYVVEVTTTSPGATGTFALSVHGPRTPVLPDTLVQRGVDSITAIPFGAVIGGPALTLRGWVGDPDGVDTLRLEVELQPVGTPFSNVATHTSGPGTVDRRAFVAVDGLLDDTGYHWQARTVDQTGRASAWLSADNNLETSPDFTVQISQPPDPPSGAGQYRSDETTAIPVGGSSDTRSVVVKASVSDPDPGDQLRLEVEVKPVGTAFTNTPSASSPVVANGATATVTVAGLNDGIGYHWQSRVVDQSSLGSAWTPFGGNGEGSADFTVQVPATALSFSVQPSNTVAGVTVSPAIQVRAVDAIGNTASSFNSDITLSIQSGPAGGSLTGTATVTASAGVAVFNNVQLPIAGTYTLRADAGGLTAISNGFTISPAAATVLVFTVEPVNTEATKVITPPVQVTARDQFGNTATGFTGNVMMTVAVNPGGATLGGTTTVSANAGVAAFSTLTLDKTGTGYRLRAAATGLTPDTSAVFDIFPAGATKLRFTTQPPSSVVAGATMSTVRVTVQDNVDNTVTTYTGPVTVALGANPGNTSLKGTTTVNAVLGVASFSTLSVDTAAAGYTLVATAPGLTGDTSSGFSVTAASPDHLAFVVQPTTTTAGAPITPSVQVAVHDQFGNLVTTFTNNITVALGNNPPGNGVLDGTKTVAASGGIATYPTLNIDEAGVGYTLVATRGGLTSATSVAFDIVHAPPTQLEYVVQPSSTAAGELITPAVQVRARDQFGNTATTFTANITIAIGNNPGGGALGGTTVQPADAGIATFAGLSIDKVGTGYTLLATATGLTPATSNAFNIGSGTAVKLAFQVQPSNTTAGATIAPAIQVVALDALNNVASDFTANIALAIGVNPPGNGVLDGPTSVAAVAGVATFNVDIDEAGTGYTLTASSGALQGATSNAFNITAGPPTKLAFTVQPSNAAANAVITPAVRVAAQDAFGNLVTTFAGNVTVAIGTNPPGTGQLDGPATVAAGGGVAIFNALDIDEAGTGYTLTASSGALTAATSAAFNITAGPATQLAFTTQPSNTTAGAPISPAVVVTARDQFGNTATGFTSNVTVAIGTNPSGGVLSGTSTVGAVAGQATFSNLKIDKAGLGYTLLASSGALNAPPSNAFDITEGGPVRVHFSVQPPASTTAGMAMSPAIEVVVQDGVGNTVTSYNGQVVVNIFDNPGSGTLSGTTQRTAVNGVATFNNLSIDKVGTGYTLLAAASGLNTEVSTLFTITAGAPTQIAVNAGNNQTATVNTAVATPPSVIVRDAFNNPVAGRSVTFAVTSGGGSISPASPAVIVTNASGIAALTSWTLGTTAGTGNNTLSATSAGLTGSPVTFTASATAGPATQMALNAGNSQTATVGTAVATPPSVIVRDAFNNPVAGRSVTFTVTGGGGTISPASPAVVATDAAGIAALTSWTLGPTAGTSNNTLSAASTGLTGSPVNFTASATAGAVSAAQSTVTATPTTITASNGSSQTTITVTAKDALGNPISGATVVLAASGTGNTLTQPVGTTNASGVATGTLSSNVAPQVETVSATINGTAITQTASVTVQVGAISAAQSTVGAAPTTITASNGSSQSTITVTVKDALGNPISGATVVLAATGTGNTLTQPVSQTNASGVATGTLSSTVAEPKTVSATANGAGITQTVLVTVQVGGVSASMSTVSASPTTIAASNGSNQSTITVTARDDVGNPISGATVVLAATGTGNTLTQPIGPTNASGVATGTLSSTVAEIKTVSATAAGVGITQTAAVTVQPGAVSASQSTVGASPSTITASSGSSQSTITVTAKDALGNPISGATVVLAATGTNNTLTQPVGTTNASGVATGTLSSTKAEAKTVSATISGVGITQTAAVTVQPAAVSAAQSTLTASHATITACATSCVVGTTASTITVTAKDQFGNPVGSAGVTIASTGSNNAFSPNATGTADASGVYAATFTSTTAEAKTISATAGGVGITQTAAVTVQSGTVSAAQSTVSASPTSIPSGGSQSTITVTAKDQFSNPISGATVVISATGTGNTVTQPAGPTNASGVATGALSSTVAEVKTVSATAAGVDITQTVDVNVAVVASAVQSSLVVATDTIGQCLSGCAVGSDASRVTVTVRDGGGNPLAGAAVTLSSSANTRFTNPGPSGVTDGSGNFSADFTSSQATNKTISATANGVSITQTATVATMPVLVGAGDITDCTKAGDDATANQLDSIPGTVFTTGDNAYPNGTTTNFASCYDPTWGRHKSRTRPTPGNHDYDSSLVAAPYFAYFGSNAGTSPDGYYSYNVGNWHIIALNDNVPMTANSAQVQWLRADLNGRSNQCVLAYWHRPRYSSGPAGPTTGTQALWQALADSGADVVLWGHEHSYERLEKMDAAGAVSATGIRAIVVGTGGGETLVSGFPNLQATSLVRDNTSRGVLRLTLFPNSYRWEYLPASGFGTFTDSGSDNCN